MIKDNRNTEMAENVRQDSEFIKRVADFVNYIVPEYIKDSPSPRSLFICAADCIDAKEGKHAMAHILVGDKRIELCALRSFMQADDDLASQVYLLAAENGNLSVKDIDDDIKRAKIRLRYAYLIMAIVSAWSLTLLAFLLFGFGKWYVQTSNLLLMLFTSWMVYKSIADLRRVLKRLRSQRKEALRRERLMACLERMKNFFEEMRRSIMNDDDD